MTKGFFRNKKRAFYDEKEIENSIIEFLKEIIAFIAY